MMRADRLREVADVIDAYPGRFATSFVVSQPGTFTPARRYSHEALRAPDCKLALCFAGWTLLAFEPDLLHPGAAGLPQIERAAELLDFAPLQARWAFYPGAHTVWGGGRQAWAKAGDVVRGIADGRLRVGDRYDGTAATNGARRSLA